MSVVAVAVEMMVLGPELASGDILLVCGGTIFLPCHGMGTNAKFFHLSPSLSFDFPLAVCFSRRSFFCFIVCL